MLSLSYLANGSTQSLSIGRLLSLICAIFVKNSKDDLYYHFAKKTHIERYTRKYRYLILQREKKESMMLQKHEPPTLERQGFGAEIF